MVKYLILHVLCVLDGAVAPASDTHHKTILILTRVCISTVCAPPHAAALVYTILDPAPPIAWDHRRLVGSGNVVLLDLIGPERQSPKAKLQSRLLTENNLFHVTALPPARSPFPRAVRDWQRCCRRARDLLYVQKLQTEPILNDTTIREQVASYERAYDVNFPSESERKHYFSFNKQWLKL